MRLAPGEVLVWSMEVGSPSEEDITRWRRMLDPDEIAQADRHQIRSGRVTYIAAHALTRALLSHVGPVAPAEWRFTIGDRGKPELHSSLGSNLRFNLSHTFGLVAAAVCVEHDLGIDIEAGDRGTHGLRVAERFFSAPEVALVRDRAGEERKEAFFRIWTLKESYIKATGEGFRRSLQSFSFTLDPLTITFTPEPSDDPGGWQFFEARPTARHFLAVTLRRPAHESATFRWRALAPEDVGAGSAP